MEAPAVRLSVLLPGLTAYVFVILCLSLYFTFFYIQFLERRRMKLSSIAMRFRVLRGIASNNVWLGLPHQLRATDR